MSKKVSNFLAQAADELFNNLQAKYALPDEAASFLQLELLKIIVDYNQLMVPREPKNEGDPVNEYEMVLVKHKNRSTFISSYCDRVGCTETQAIRVYDKLRQKLEKAK